MADYEKILNDAAEHFRALLTEQLHRQERMAQGTPARDFAHMEHIVIGLIPGDGIGPIIMTQARRVLEKLGVDQVVVPELEQAQRLARILQSHNVLDYIELSKDYGILEVPAPKSWADKSIRELNVRAKMDINIIAVKNGEKTMVSPSADYRIHGDDVLAVLGDTAALEAMQKL